MKTFTSSFSFLGVVFEDKTRIITKPERANLWGRHGFDGEDPTQGVIGIALESIYGVFAMPNHAKTAPISKKRG
ncbi:MAG: hypothetical protein IJU64_04060 [Bacilli bacterium]|nr:hypothetical protein [Bacilli bacterium]